jgi:hypothetical protein
MVLPKGFLGTKWKKFVKVPQIITHITGSHREREREKVKDK